MRFQPGLEVEAYLVSLRRLFRDGEQFEPIRRGMIIAFGAAELDAE